MGFRIKQTYRMGLLVLAMVWASMSMGSIAAADTLDDLKKQIQALQQKVELLEKQQVETKKVVDSVEEVAAKKPASKGYFIIPGTGTEIKIDGYVKLDAIYSDKSAGDESAADQYFDPPSIPLDNAAKEETDQFGLHARQSRFNIATATDSPFGKFRTYFEGDFFGSGGNQNVSNSYGLRLRHAYGELGKFLAGQTWTTFGIMDSLPETLDFGGPVAQVFARQAMVRWTEPFKWGSLQFAAENPNASTLNANGVKSATDDDHMPDLVGRANFKSAFGSYSVALLARQLSWDDGINSDETWGGAISLGARIPTFGKDDLRFQFNYGNALGRYMTTGFADMVLNETSTTPEVDTFDQWGAIIAYRHFWLDNLRSNLVYSYGEADNDLDIVPTGVNSQFQSIHGNLIWSPCHRIDLGLEYLYGLRELENGEEGDLNRVQFSAQYHFF